MPATKRGKAAAPAPAAKVQKVAKPAAKAPPPAKAPAKPAAKKASKKVKEPDTEEFAEALMDVCKVLMILCKTTVTEDADKMTVTKTEDFSAHGHAILALLPEEARLWMMKLALMFQEELDEDPYMDFLDEDEDEEAGGEEEDDGENDVIKPGLFYFFKQYFTSSEASAFIESSKEGGALSIAIEAALESYGDDDDSDEEGEEGEEGESEEEEDVEEDVEEDDDDDEWSANMPWKEG